MGVGYNGSLTYFRYWPIVAQFYVLTGIILLLSLIQEGLLSVTNERITQSTG